MYDAAQSVSIDAIPQATFIYDAETLRYLAVNQAAIDLYGYSREEFLAMKVSDIRPPQDVPRLHAMLAGLDSRPHRLGVWTHRTKAGVLLQMDIYSQGWMEGGRRARLIIASDVTERVRLETALRESETNFRVFFDSNPAACLVMRISDGVYTAVNDAFTTITGFAREQAVGRTWRDLNLWLEPDQRERLLVRLRADGRVADAELRFRHAGGGEFTGLLSARVIELAGQPYALTVVRDITERRRATQERLALLEQLRQSQKMEAVGRLAGGAAHDFNNVLMVVVNVTDLLLDQVGPGAPMTEDLEQIRDAAARATALTKQLLAFSRQQVLQPREFDLNALVNDLAKMVRVLLGSRNTLELDLLSAPCTVQADPTQLTQVLINLAINACDAMPDGGTLRVAVRYQEVDEEEARRRGDLQSRRYVQLTVSYGIAWQNDGVVELESAPGKGATFRVWLPAVEGPAAEE